MPLSLETCAAQKGKDLSDESTVSAVPTAVTAVFAGCQYGC